ncbi:MAG: phosphatase PAP2 family protein [Oscillospiraceae bacterium]
MAWEFDVLNWIQENLRCGLLDTVMPIITFLGNGGWFWIALTLVGFIPQKTRKYAFISAFALICCLVFGNLILKPCIARIRPFDVQTGIQLLIEKPHDYSFPSGHTQASFATATAIFFKDKRWGIGALVLAALIAFSRMYLYVHYPTDILAGVLFGVGYAIIGKLLVDRICKKRGIAA